LKEERKMSARRTLVREILRLSLLIGVLVVILIGAALLVSGAFSLVWFARIVFGVAFGSAIVELLILQRAMRVSHVRGPLATWRNTDRTQGCGIALLGALVVMGLMLCGVLMEWWAEFR
jgi:hypothetical protein